MLDVMVEFAGISWGFNQELGGIALNEASLKIEHNRPGPCLKRCSTVRQTSRNR